MAVPNYKYNPYDMSALLQKQIAEPPLPPGYNPATSQPYPLFQTPAPAAPKPRRKMPNADAPLPPDLPPDIIPDGKAGGGGQQNPDATASGEGWAEAGEGGANFRNSMRNVLAGDLANTGGQILGTVIGKQFQDWSGGSSSSLNKQAIEQSQKMGELNNQLKKAGTFATNAMGYKGAGAQISAKNAMAGFQPDAEDVMARNQANRQADKMTSTMQGQMAATNAAQDRQAGRAVDSTLKAAKQMGGPASLGAAAASGIGQTLAESALNKNAQNAQAIQGANTAAAGMRTSAAQAFNQAKDSAFNRKVQPYMNQWHEPGSESAINTGAGSSESSNRQAGDYPIYDVLGATATALGTRGGYQGSVDMHGTDYKWKQKEAAPAEGGQPDNNWTGEYYGPPKPEATSSASNVNQASALQQQLAGGQQQPSGYAGEPQQLIPPEADTGNMMGNQLDILTGKAWERNLGNDPMRQGGSAGGGVNKNFNRPYQSPAYTNSDYNAVNDATSGLQSQMIRPQPPLSRDNWRPPQTSVPPQPPPNGWNTDAGRYDEQLGTSYPQQDAASRMRRQIQYANMMNQKRNSPQIPYRR